MATAAELTYLDSDELEIRLTESRRELLNLRFQLATGQLDNSARMGQVRKDVARILTVLRDREIREAEGTYEPHHELEFEPRHEAEDVDDAETSIEDAESDEVDEEVG